MYLANWTRKKREAGDRDQQAWTAEKYRRFDRGVTRRRNLDAPDECWHVFYGDVRVGTLAIRTGMPPGEDPWCWVCGFYPGSHPRECSDGTAKTFSRARADSEAAWRVFLSHRTEADLQAWREQRDWTMEKYRRFDRGERMPPDWRAPHLA